MRHSAEDRADAHDRLDAEVLQAVEHDRGKRTPFQIWLRRDKQAQVIGVLEARSVELSARPVNGPFASADDGHQRARVGEAVELLGIHFGEFARFQIGDQVTHAAGAARPGVDPAPESHQRVRLTQHERVRVGQVVDEFVGLGHVAQSISSPR